MWSHDTLSIQEKAVELSRTMSPIYECNAGCSSLPASTRECLRFRFVLCVLLLLSYFAFCCFCRFFFLYLFYKIATVTINGYFILTPSMSMIKQIQWGGPTIYSLHFARVSYLKRKCFSVTILTNIFNFYSSFCNWRKNLGTAW